MKKSFILCSTLFILSCLHAEETTIEKGFPATAWGAGAAVRSTNVPYAAPFAQTNGENTSSFIHLLYFEGEHFYMDGTEIGYRAPLTDAFSIAAITKLRMADIPEAHQNAYQLDGYDPGVQLRYSFDKGNYAQIEAMTDMHNNFYANLYYQYSYGWGDFDCIPYAQATYKNSGFNTYYYGLGAIDTEPTHNLGAGVDLSLGLDVWYHLASNFYLYGKAQTKFLNSEAKKSPYVSESRQDEFWLGFAFKNDKNQPLEPSLKSRPYIRLAYGFATVSNLGEIFVGNVTHDDFENRMISLFYGHPVSDTFFNLPISIYFTPGIVWHQTSQVQKNSYEVVAAMKAYYTIPLPWRVRLGVGTGISYITNTTYIEDVDMDPGEKSSKLLQYLDFSVDMNMGDIFGKNVEKLWLGYGIHHRSAVFESASEYGYFKGGSNYNTVYLQYHF